MRIDCCGLLVEARGGDVVGSGVLALHAVAVVREPTEHAGLLLLLVVDLHGCPRALLEVDNVVGVPGGSEW